MVSRFKWKLFGQRLRDTREAAGLGLREAARDLKVSHATWCRAEHGEPISVPHFVKLCDWMNEIPGHFHPDIP